VVDTAMIDGAAVLMSMIWGFRAMNAFDEEHRGTNVLDTGCPFYDTYECKDGKFISLGSLEIQFYEELLEKTGLASAGFPEQMDREGWPMQRERFTELFKTKTRDEWNAILEGSDACYAPVLTMTEAAQHPHIQARGTVVDFEGVLQPAPAPRFSRTKPEITRGVAKPGEHTDEVLTEWGFSKGDLAKLRDAGAIA
jgi:alpha-methylacyl-CoA racemase